MIHDQLTSLNLHGFNFTVTLINDAGAPSVQGSFTDVSGVPGATKLQTRSGFALGNAVSLKRGVMPADGFRDWIDQTSRNPDVGREVSIALRDERGSVTSQWTLNDARPEKWTGPVFDAENGLAVFEELVLTCSGANPVEL